MLATVSLYRSSAYAKLGETKKQKELLEQALPPMEEYHGKNHPVVAEILVHLGTAHGYLGHVKKQKRFLNRALPILKKNGNEPMIVMALIWLNLTDGHIELVEQALPTLERYYDKNHYRYAEVLVDLGNLYGKSGNLTEQQKLLKQALPILKKHYGEDSYMVAKVKSKLAYAYKNSNNHLGKMNHKAS
jgi:tetratricopeptide (TPR) repeat protein